MKNIEEINKLISEIRSKIEQNQRLLARLSEVTDKILSSTLPALHGKTYNRSGHLKSLGTDLPSLDEEA